MAMKKGDRRDVRSVSRVWGYNPAFRDIGIQGQWRAFWGRVWRAGRGGESRREEGGCTRPSHPSRPSSEKWPFKACRANALHSASGTLSGDRRTGPVPSGVLASDNMSETLSVKCQPHPGPDVSNRSGGWKERLWVTAPRGPPYRLLGECRVPAAVPRSLGQLPHNPR